MTGSTGETRRQKRGTQTYKEKISDWIARRKSLAQKRAPKSGKRARGFFEQIEKIHSKISLHTTLEIDESER